MARDKTYVIAELKQGSVLLGTAAQLVDTGVQTISIQMQLQSQPTEGIACTCTVYLAATLASTSETALASTSVPDIRVLAATNATKMEGGFPLPSTEVTLQSCATLGWDFKYGSRHVCSSSGQCHSNQNYASAHDKCRAVGARLCTHQEVQSWVARGTGCAFDWKKMWTATPRMFWHHPARNCT